MSNELKKGVDFTLWHRFLARRTMQNEPTNGEQRLRRRTINLNPVPIETGSSLLFLSDLRDCHSGFQM